MSAGWLPLAVLMTSVIPSLIFILLQTGSMAPGIVVCASLWLAYGVVSHRIGGAWSDRNSRTLGMVLLLLSLAIIHALVIDTWIGGVNFPRLIGSCATVIIMLMGANVAARILLTLTPAALTVTARSAFWVLTAFGYMAVAHVPSVGGAAYEKPVIVFTEPSHFSFVYLPMLIFMVANATRGRQMLLLVSGLLIGALLENLTMLVGILGASCLILRKYQILLLLAAAALGAGALALDLSYYADRLAFSADSDNLSTLVYLQGWQRAWLNLQETDGLGVGFQQFGYVGSLGGIVDRIVQMVGNSLNLYDGGSTGSKLIAELGVTGIVAIAFYMRLVVRGVSLIRRSQQLPPHKRDVRALFFYSFLIAYVSELFIRGTGYLSPSGFLIMTALIALPKVTAVTRTNLVPALGQPSAV